MTDEHRILTRQRGVTERTLAYFERAIEAHPVSAPEGVHPLVHSGALRGMESVRDDLRARIIELDAEIQVGLAQALWDGMGSGTHPTVARRRAASSRV